MSVQEFSMSVRQRRLRKDCRVPDAVPRVNLAVVHIVLLSGVEDKFTLMGSIFL